MGRTASIWKKTSAPVVSVPCVLEECLGAIMICRTVKFACEYVIVVASGCTSIHAACSFTLMGTA